MVKLMASSDSDSGERYKRSQRRKSRSTGSESSRRRRPRRPSGREERLGDRGRSSRERHQRRSPRRHRERRSDSGRRSKSKMDATKHERSKRAASSSSSLSSKSADRSQKSSLSKNEVICRNKEKVQAALKAAATSDQHLKTNQKQRIATEEVPLDVQMSRANAIEEIDSGRFVQSEFKSSRGEIPLPKGDQNDAAHSAAMFSSSRPTQTLRPANRIIDPGDPAYLFHPSLMVSVGDKMERWRSKLQTLREKNLKRRFV